MLATLDDAGIDPEQVTSVDPDKVADALAVSTLSDRDLFEVEETEYVRKADVDEAHKETRLQGLKDRLAASDDAAAAELREEIETLEAWIAELTEFESGKAFHTGTAGDP